ncbi:MAG: AMMECR1 domain-containing protein [Ignavibacteria bacterium RIFOXYA2_FULL_37_17]|nr:MAG: AMMECR1 domain-containing protein [Ignavibacteria bacterium RIFOXYA2_FULL_37_17]
MEITLEEKKILLDTARISIKSVFTGEKIPGPDYGTHPIFNSHAGTFVTLTKSGSLRGCIGYIISDSPLFETVCDAAVQASQNDPRFPSVRQSEIKDLSIEISVLSEPFPLNNYDEIEIGKHGLILEEKGKRGLLLPQVPIEHHMNREQYLDAICRKSGFPPGYWKTKQLKLHAFTATIFCDSSVSSESDEEVK